MCVRVNVHNSHQLMYMYMCVRVNVHVHNLHQLNNGTKFCVCSPVNQVCSIAYICLEFDSRA